MRIIIIIIIGIFYLNGSEQSTGNRKTWARIPAAGREGSFFHRNFEFLISLIIIITMLE